MNVSNCEHSLLRHLVLVWSGCSNYNTMITHFEVRRGRLSMFPKKIHVYNVQTIAPNLIPMEGFSPLNKWGFPLLNTDGQWVIPAITCKLPGWPIRLSIIVTLHIKYVNLYSQTTSLWKREWSVFYHKNFSGSFREDGLNKGVPLWCAVTHVCLYVGSPEAEEALRIKWWSGSVVGRAASQTHHAAINHAPALPRYGGGILIATCTIWIKYK